MRWPKISWKKTPLARPERIAGPVNGSITGALRKVLVNLPFVSAMFSKGASRFVSEQLERCRFFFAVCQPKA